MEKEVKKVFWNLPVPAIIIDKSNRKILCVSSCLLSLLGYGEEELVNKDFSSLIPFDGRKKILQYIGALWGEKIVSRDMVILCSNGEVCLTNISLRLTELTGRSLIIAVLKDITEEKKKEKEKKVLLQAIETNMNELSALKAELARSTRLKEEFLASMSHELKTPLNSILGMSGVLQEKISGDLNELQVKYVSIIEESGRHLLSLVNDILDLSRIEAGKFEVSIDKVSVRNVCSSALKLISDLVEKKNIKVDEFFDENVISINSDKNRLKQILFNLLSNAVKFTPEGSKIGFEVRGFPDDGKVEFTVWDRGIGIDKKDMKYLFKPFMQLDRSLSRRYSGSGLGLVLVDRLTEFLGGGITLSSEVGRGSRFTVALPWKDRIEDFDKEGEVKVLIIDDTPETTYFIKDYFKAIDIKPFSHFSGDGAFDKVRKVLPDLVIMDIMLPGFSGWDILAELKKDEITRDIPVIISSVIDDRDRGFSLGASEYIVKPFAIDNLDEIVRKFFPHKKTLLKDSNRQILILLAEDNDITIKTFLNCLKPEGYKVIVARNGSEVIERVGKNKPHIILMDIQMPGMDGLEATRYIREELGSAVPVVALSSISVPGQKEDCLKAGANEYVKKPVNRKKLLSVIDKFLFDAEIDLLKKGSRRFSEDSVS